MFDKDLYLGVHLVKLVTTFFQGSLKLVDIILKLGYLIVLNRDDCILLVQLLLMLNLLIVGKKQCSFKLTVELSHFLINAQKNFLLPHNFDRLDAVDFFLVNGSKLRGVELAFKTTFLACKAATVFVIFKLPLSLQLVFEKSSSGRSFFLLFDIREAEDY